MASSSAQQPNGASYARDIEKQQPYGIDAEQSASSSNLPIDHQQQRSAQPLRLNDSAAPVVFTPSVGSTLGTPTALGIGAFATTLGTLSFSLMGFRGVDTTNVFIGNFFFVAGIGMLITAQWELVRGNSFGYTVLSAFGLFYAGFGAIITPAFGVLAAYDGDMVMYNNALGFWVLMWAVFNLFFTIGSAPINLVYFGIFFFVQLAFTLIAAAYFTKASGYAATGTNLDVAGGVFAFLAALLGYYTVGHLMCQEATPFFDWPMGDTAKYFKKHTLNESRPAPMHERREDL